MTTQETSADYSLEISIVRKFSSDGAALCTRSYEYRNLRTQPLVIDWDVVFRVTDKNVGVEKTARTSTGAPLTAKTRDDGDGVRIWAEPNVTIPPGATWSIEFSYEHPEQAKYVTSLDLWLCHESWRFYGPRVGTARESTPRRYRYSAQILDERRKVLGIPFLLQFLEAGGQPHRNIKSTRNYLELTWNFSVYKDRPYELSVMFAERPWKYRGRVIGVAGIIATAVITAVTGVDIPA